MIESNGNSIVFDTEENFIQIPVQNISRVSCVNDGDGAKALIFMKDKTSVSITYLGKKKEFIERYMEAYNKAYAYSQMRFDDV